MRCSGCPAWQNTVCCLLLIQENFATRPAQPWAIPTNAFFLFCPRAREKFILHALVIDWSLLWSDNASIIRAKSRACTLHYWNRLSPWACKNDFRSRTLIFSYRFNQYKGVPGIIWILGISGLLGFNSQCNHAWKWTFSLGCFFYSIVSR